MELCGPAFYPPLVHFTHVPLRMPNRQQTEEPLIRGRPFLPGGSAGGGLPYGKGKGGPAVLRGQALPAAQGAQCHSPRMPGDFGGHMLHLCCHLFRSKQSGTAGGGERSSSYSKAEGCAAEAVSPRCREADRERVGIHRTGVQILPPSSPTPPPG